MTKRNTYAPRPYRERTAVCWWRALAAIALGWLVALLLGAATARADYTPSVYRVAGYCYNQAEMMGTAVLDRGERAGHFNARRARATFDECLTRYVKGTCDTDFECSVFYGGQY